CCRGVPVVAGGDHENVHLAIENTAKVFQRLRRLFRDLLDDGGGGCGALLVNVTDIGDGDAGLLREGSGQRLAAVASAHNSNDEVIVGGRFFIGGSANS